MPAGRLVGSGWGVPYRGRGGARWGGAGWGWWASFPPRGGFSRARGGVAPRASAGPVGHRMADVRLGLLDIFPDKVSLYRSLWLLAPQYLRRHVLGGRDLPEDEAMVVLRDWLAGRLRADFEVANSGLPSRYSPNYRVGVEPLSWQAELLAKVRGESSRAGDAEVDELVVELAAMDLGLPLLLVSEEGTLKLGPEGIGRLPIIRTGNHYVGGVWLDEDAPEPAWWKLAPNQASSAQEAGRIARAQLR